MAFTVADLTDNAVFLLDKFKRNKKPEDILVHIEDKPLLRRLIAGKEEYGSGKDNFSEPVQGAKMSDVAGFYRGTQGDDQLVFTDPAAAVDTQFAFKLMTCGLQMTRDDLMKHGIDVVPNSSKMEFTAEEANRLADFMGTKEKDFEQSKAIARNEMLWGDGTGDTKAIAGLQSIITLDPTAGSCGGISRANVWWQHIARTGVGAALPKVSYSKSDQTLTQTLDYDFTQLGRYGGRPNVWLAGSDYIDAVKREMRAAGQQTVTGWADAKTGILIKGIRVGPYDIEYDPTMDTRGHAKRLYAFDDRKLKLRPMKNHWDRNEPRNEPADQLLYMVACIDRGTLSSAQQDCLLVHILE